MKYINQLDYPHWPYITRTDMEDAEYQKGQKTTVRSSGCGLCSAVMVADQLLPNCTFDLQDALRLSYDVLANHKKGTDFSRFAPAFAKKLGLKLERTDDPQRLLYCLQTGGAAVVLVRGDRKDRVGLFSHGGHYIAAIGLDEDGKVIILDPSLKDGKYDEPGREGKVTIQNDVILHCALADVVEDALSETAQSISFSLFWRTYTNS